MDIYNYFQNNYFRIVYFLSVGFLALAGAIVYIQGENLQQLLIIHFDTFNGIDVLGTRSHIFGILGTAVALNVLNAYTALMLSRRDYFLARLLSIINMLVTFLLLLTILVIIHVN